MLRPLGHLVSFQQLLIYAVGAAGIDRIPVQIDQLSEQLSGVVP